MVYPQLTVAELKEALADADPRAVIILKSPGLTAGSPDVIENLEVVRVSGPVVVLSAKSGLLARG